jgi:hypothetical protein
LRGALTGEGSAIGALGIFVVGRCGSADGDGAFGGLVGFHMVCTNSFQGIIRLG